MIALKSSYRYFFSWQFSIFNPWVTDILLEGRKKSCFTHNYTSFANIWMPFSPEEADGFLLSNWSRFVGIGQPVPKLFRKQVGSLQSGFSVKSVFGTQIHDILASVVPELEVRLPNDKSRLMRFPDPELRICPGLSKVNILPKVDQYQKS